MSEEKILPARPGSGTQPRAVLDTDAANQIDDQFAIAYLLSAPDRAHTDAIYAAPYAGRGVSSPADGMEKSFDEIGRVLDTMEVGDVPVFRGSDRFLSGGLRPAAPDRTGGSDPADYSPGAVDSNAASDLAERAMSATHSDRLNVIAIGALTNVASALLIEPQIAERCTVIWLGGHHPSWPENSEFNLQGDVAAARVVFDSGVPLYVVPCKPVASHLLVTHHELHASMSADSPVSRILYSRFVGWLKSAAGTPEARATSKVLWDLAAVAWLVLPGSVHSYHYPTPRIASDGSYVHDPRRPACRLAYELDRDAISTDFFTRLGQHGQPQDESEDG